MIEITEPKLLALKEYMEAKIDSGALDYWVDITSVPQRTCMDDLLLIWRQTGMIYQKHPDHPTAIKALSFEDYYKNMYLVSPKNLIIQVQNQPLNI